MLKHLKNQQLAIYAFVFMLLVAGIVGAEKYRAAEAAKYRKIEADKAAYTFYIQQHRTQQLQTGNSGTGPKPILRNEIQNVQNQLMSKMALAKLDTTSINVVSQAQSDKAEAIEFEVNANGSWDGILGFLNSLRTEPVLITLRSIKMEPGQEKIKTQFKYKLYLAN